MRLLQTKDCRRVELKMKALFFLVVILAVFVPSGFAANMSDVVRPPAVAGQFYPDSPEALKGAVQNFLRDAVPRTAVKPIAIVVPHAGYIFSGQIAADGFKQAEGESCEVVVILARTIRRRVFRRYRCTTAALSHSPGSH